MVNSLLKGGILLESDTAELHSQCFELWRETFGGSYSHFQLDEVVKKMLVFFISVKRADAAKLITLKQNHDAKMDGMKKTMANTDASTRQNRENGNLLTRDYRYSSAADIEAFFQSEIQIIISSFEFADLTTFGDMSEPEASAHFIKMANAVSFKGDRLAMSFADCSYTPLDSSTSSQKPDCCLCANLGRVRSSWETAVFIVEFKKGAFVKSEKNDDPSYLSADGKLALGQVFSRRLLLRAPFIFCAVADFEEVQFFCLVHTAEAVSSARDYMPYNTVAWPEAPLNLWERNDIVGGRRGVDFLAGFRALLPSTFGFYPESSFADTLVIAFGRMACGMVKPLSRIVKVRRGFAAEVESVTTSIDVSRYVLDVSFEESELDRFLARVDPQYHDMLRQVKPELVKVKVKKN